MAVMERNLGGKNAASAASEKRKKMFVIGASVLLVLLLAFQIPKVLKQLHPQAAASSAPSATTTPGATTTGLPMTTPATGSAQVGKHPLRKFKAHDPFKPLIKGDAAQVTTTTPPATTTPPPATTPTGTTGGTSQSGGASAGATETTPQGPIGFTAPKAGAPAVPQTPPAAAVILVNGASLTIGLKASFPVKEPAFKLVAVTRKTVKIRVLGGAFANGKPTITIERGKKVTLVNTTTGVRYVLRFSAPLAALPESAQAAPSGAGSGNASATTTTSSKTK